MAYREQRQQAIEKAKQGFAPSEIAEMLHVPIRSVQRWIRAAKEDGSLKISDSLQLHITEISNENDLPVNGSIPNVQKEGEKGIKFAIDTREE